MKKYLFFFSTLFFLPSISSAQTYVKPYYKSDGTYVQGHYRSNPNNTRLDNWSTRGNTNPYNGNKGYKNPYRENGYNSNQDNDYNSNYDY